MTSPGNKPTRTRTKKTSPAKPPPLQVTLEVSKEVAAQRASSHTLYRKGAAVNARINGPKGYTSVPASVVRSYPYPTKSHSICAVVVVTLADGRTLKLTSDRISKRSP